MSAAINIPKNYYFDRTELVPELELVFRAFQPVKPIRTGGKLPDFNFQKENTKWQHFSNGVMVNGSMLLRELLNKPLVIGFYSTEWQNYGIDILKRLNAIQREIKAEGGNLVIITDQKERKLENVARQHSLSLNFYFDNEKQIAEKFGIYSEYDPVWNWFSGIDVNVPLLAAYVISPAGQIEYGYAELDFSADFPADDIISSVQRAASFNNKVINISSPVG